MLALSNMLLEHNCDCVLTRCLGLLVHYKDGARSCQGDCVAGIKHSLLGLLWDKRVCLWFLVHIVLGESPTFRGGGGRAGRNSFTDSPSVPSVAPHLSFVLF